MPIIFRKEVWAAHSLSLPRQPAALQRRGRGGGGSNPEMHQKVVGGLCGGKEEERKRGEICGRTIFGGLNRVGGKKEREKGGPSFGK